MNVKCVKCGAIYEVQINKIKDGIYDVEFLSCPHCRDVQITTVWTDELKRIADQIREFKSQKIKAQAMKLLKDAEKRVKAEYLAFLRERDNHENNKS